MIEEVERMPWDDPIVRWIGGPDWPLHPGTPVDLREKAMREFEERNGASSIVLQKYPA